MRISDWSSDVCSSDLNIPAIERLHRDEGTTLLMVLDSGTMAFEPMARAAEHGLDRIILDHHDAKEEVPSGILVNHKRRDEDGSLSSLCAAGLRSDERPVGKEGVSPCNTRWWAY